MKIYKVINITEQDYGCEELLPGQKYCVDVLLQDTQNNETITISAPDDELYKKHIDVNSFVVYNDNSLNLYK